MFSFDLDAADKNVLAATESANTTIDEMILSLEDANLQLADVGDEIAALEEMGNEIDRLEMSVCAMEEFGLNQAMLETLDYDGLLSSTCLAMPAVESLVAELVPSDPQVTVAIEGMMETVKNKVSEWATAAMNAVTSLGSKIAAGAKAVWAKLTEWYNWAKEKTWDAAAAAKETIKAHPYASAAAAVAAAAGVGLVIAAIWGPGLTVMTTSAGTWMSGVNAAIRKAGTTIGGWTVQMGGKAKTMVSGGYEAAKSGTITALGWTKDKAMGLFQQLAGLFKEGGAMSKAFASIKNFGSRVVNGLKNAVKAPFAKGEVSAYDGHTMIGAGAARRAGQAVKNAGGAVKAGAISAKDAVWGAITATWKYLRAIVGTIQTVVMGAFRSIRPAFAVHKAGGTATIGKVRGAIRAAS